MYSAVNVLRIKISCSNFGQCILLDILVVQQLCNISLNFDRSLGRLQVIIHHIFFHKTESLTCNDFF